MRKLALFTVGFAAATALLVYLLGGIGWFAAAAAGVFAVACFFLRKRKIFAAAFLVLLGACVGALWCSVYTVLLPSAETYCKEEAVSFTAVVETGAEKTSYGWKVEASVGEERLKTVLYFREELPQILPGDTLRGEAKFSPVSLMRTEEDDLYAASRDIRLTGNVRGELEWEAASCVGFRHKIARFAIGMKGNLRAALPAQSAEYFVALATGDRSGLSFDFQNRMSLCGLSHAVSLSGMHVSILMSAVYLLCLRRKRLGMMLGLPILVLFVLLTGGRASTIRAVVMQMVLCAGILAKREYDPPTSLSAALLLILLQSPWSVAQWGLQLSFLSTLGIVTLCPKFMELLTRRPMKSLFLRKVLLGLWAPMAVTLSATVFSLPLLSIYFGVLSLVGPLCNLLCLWSVSVSFVGAVLTALAGFVSPDLAAGMGRLLHPLSVYLDSIITVCSAPSWAAVFREAPLIFLWGAFAYGLTCVALLNRCKRWLLPLCLGASLALCLFLHGKTLPQNECTVLDVGQGQCVLCIREDTVWVIDCGGRGEETGELAARYLLSRGIKAVEGVVLTHFDEDHTAGLSQLQRRLPVGQVLTPDTVEELRKIPVPGGSITVYPAMNAEKDNDAGLCILASAGDCDILITGDLSRDAEAHFLSRYDIPDGDILVAGHHGAASSTSDVLLNAFRPEVVLISAGNRYGHPSPETLKRIARSGAAAYATKTNGNLTVRW